MKNPKNWNDFLQLCSGICLNGNLKYFFELFLTIEERENLASRYCIIKALLDGELTQREIAAKFNVSIAQITRGSNALKLMSVENKQQLKQCLEAAQNAPKPLRKLS